MRTAHPLFSTVLAGFMVAYAVIGFTFAYRWGDASPEGRKYRRAEMLSAGAFFARGVQLLAPGLGSVGSIVVPVVFFGCLIASWVMMPPPRRPVYRREYRRRPQGE